MPRLETVSIRELLLQTQMIVRWRFLFTSRILRVMIVVAVHYPSRRIRKLRNFSTKARFRPPLFRGRLLLAHPYPLQWLPSEGARMNAEIFLSRHCQLPVFFRVSAISCSRTSPMARAGLPRSYW